MSSTPSRPAVNGFHRPANGSGNNSSARRANSVTRDGSSLPQLVAPEEGPAEEDPVHELLQARWKQSERHISALFGADAKQSASQRASPKPVDAAAPQTTAEESAKTAAPPKKAARQIDDDYGDDEEDEEEEEVDKQSPLKSKGKTALPNGISSVSGVSTPLRAAVPVGKPSGNAAGAPRPGTASTSDSGQTSEDVRKQLEQEKEAAAEAARQSFQNMFYTLENDHDAMVEQQKLDELDREVEDEISGGPNAPAAAANNGLPNGATQGSLGTADLGASSLTLKHLIARIDMKRDMVQASDNQLRTLISEVRKGRSKWASEDRVGQEELYEAAEKVLMELKAMTEYAQPFLQRVSKREAPDYFNIIKTPMDIGTMIKKLKQYAYKSKKDFVDDLSLIWTNCLRYNQDPAHPLRKKALYMRKQTDEITRLIPDVVIRDRAEIEAEERRLQMGDADDSDDDDAPIMASRGRKAPKKGVSSSARKAPPASTDDTATPAPDQKPALHASASNLRGEFLRAESDAPDVNSAGFNTPPPPGFATPQVNGVHGSGAAGSQADVMEVDGVGNTIIPSTELDLDEDDAEFKTWKQVTKKDRAQAAAERNRLFRGDRLDPDQPALLRNKAMMRRWARQQKMITAKPSIDADPQEGADGAAPSAGGETLAEGIEKDEDSTLPDYYNPVSAIPDLDERWRWTTDSEGNAVPHTDEYMRMYPKGRFLSHPGDLNKKLEGNIRQMQDTRKVCAKIGIVKQMQIQAQTYQNQFQKYEPEPFVEKDVGAVVVSEEGPLMAPWVNRAALQRSVGKIFYHAGFEDFQPSAMDAMTDVATDFIAKVGASLKLYNEQPRTDPAAPRYTFEEQVLHTLDENGMDLEAIESYIRDDVERQNTKLGVVHERMKSHLADLLRPALGDHAGADGAGAFNDGSEQFVGGDFAEDMDEDFFGFRELGLMAEFGLESLSVPLHLLQNRMHSAYQAQNQGPVNSTGLVFEPPPPYEAISHETLSDQIGIVQDFFRARLRNNHDDPLVEDEDLPQKQRFPKPRLPPTGKISSPRKRPLREQQQMAKKKRKLEEQGLLLGSGEKGKVGKIQPLKLQMPSEMEETMDPEKDGATIMISPESINGGL